MISPPIQLAPDAARLSTSPQKIARSPKDTSREGATRPATGATMRLPLSEIPALRPPSAEAQLLPDGGRGSPMKGACTTFYPPPPTFSVRDIHQHISTKASAPPVSRPPTKDPIQLVTPKTSPAQGADLTPTSPTELAHAATEVSDMELSVDDGTKPPYSYATLIGMAILRASDRKLTLSAIYNWISGTFSYYSQSEAGWQNSIRHNLSLNKAFVKVERPKDEPGKGHYWTVEAGCEAQFLKARVGKKPTGNGGAPGRAGTTTTTTTTISKKESKKRHVEFADVPRMKRILVSPLETTFDYSNKHGPASPPPTDDKRKRNSLWDYDDSGFFSPSTNVLLDDSVLFEDFPTRSEAYSKEFSYSANALDLVLSPPPSSSPMRHDKVGIFAPRTPAAAATAAPVRRVVTMASPGTSLREHRQHMLQMLTSPDTETFCPDDGGNSIDDDPWLTHTPKPKERSNSMLESPWDEVAERAAFGSPDKRESRRRESRRVLVCGLHAQELYETGFESSSMPGVNVLDIMKREVDRVKGTAAVTSLARPSLMERSQSSLF